MIKENEHLLMFAPETEEDEGPEEAIVFVSIERQTPIKENAGRNLPAFKENAGRNLPASEFPEPLSLFARFGGGGYLVKGRNHRHKIVARATRYYTFQGPSKPMNELAGAGEAPAVTMPTPVEHHGHARAVDPNLQTILLVLEKSAQNAQAQNNMMLTLMMESQKQSSQMMLQIFATIVPLMSTKSEAGHVDTAAHFREGMDHARALFEGMMEANANKSTEGDDVAATIAAISGGVEAMARLNESKAKVAAAGNGNGAPNGAPAAVTKSA